MTVDPSSGGHAQHPALEEARGGVEGHVRTQPTQPLHEGGIVGAGDALDRHTVGREHTSNRPWFPAEDRAGLVGGQRRPPPRPSQAKVMARAAVRWWEGRDKGRADHLRPLGSPVEHGLEEPRQERGRPRRRGRSSGDRRDRKLRPRGRTLRVESGRTTTEQSRAGVSPSARMRTREGAVRHGRVRARRQGGRPGPGRRRAGRRAPGARRRRRGRPARLRGDAARGRDVHDPRRAAVGRTGHRSPWPPGRASGRSRLVSASGIERSHPYLEPAGQGWPDNDHRFFAFSAAVAALTEQHAPDILHLNDWHTAAVLAFLGEPRPPTVLTIHTIAYQGRTSPAGWRSSRTAGPRSPTTATSTRWPAPSGSPSWSSP